MTPVPATPQTARAINDRTALDLFAAHGALTAAQLQQSTGLARPTVTELLARLGECGLVEQIGEVGADRPGPNARLYALAGHRACVAGIDVRAAAVYLTLTDLAGRTFAERAIELPPNTPPNAALGTVTAELATAARAGAGPLRFVTVGVPGLVNPVTGHVRPATARWHAELADAITARTGLAAGHVLLENEVNLAGIAEHRVIGPAGTDTFGLLWLGSGIGACLVLDGALRRGASGGAGELAFLLVSGTDRTPGTGGPRASLHDLIGAQGVAALAAAHGVAPTAFDHESYREALADRIALGAAAFALVVDPGVVVLGGELGRAGGTALADAVEARLAALCPVPTRVVPTAVPGNPILAGAVATALGRARAALWP
jgi:predicted NBD/HSP70 family sugar kinase